MPYILFFFEISFFFLMAAIIYYIINKIVKNLFSGFLISSPTSAPVPLLPSAIMPPDFKPNCASVDEMIDYWKNFAYQVNRAYPALAQDLTSIDDVLRQIKVKSDKEAWPMNSRPAQIRDIAEIIYVNYPGFIIEYSQLPPKMQYTPISNTKRSAYDLLIENSNFLAVKMEEISQELFLNNIKEMMVQEQFVKTKYDKSSK